MPRLARPPPRELTRAGHSTPDRLSPATRSRLEDLIAGDGTEQGIDGDGGAAGGGRSRFAELKTDRGAPGLESLLAEVNELEWVRRLELPGTTPAQTALAWTLTRGNDITSIPGTRRVTRVDENTAADAVGLTAARLDRLNNLTPAAGERHDEANMASIDR